MPLSRFCQKFSFAPAFLWISPHHLCNRHKECTNSIMREEEVKKTEEASLAQNECSLNKEFFLLMSHPYPTCAFYNTLVTHCQETAML